MKHLMKPVDAMKLRGRVTIEIAARKNAPAKEGGYTVTGTAVRPDWWPFAWPLIAERAAWPTRAYVLHDPVTGCWVSFCIGKNLDEAIEDGRMQWQRRKTKNAVRLAHYIFCDWLGADL